MPDVAVFALQHPVHPGNTTVAQSCQTHNQRHQQQLTWKEQQLFWKEQQLHWKEQH